MMKGLKPVAREYMEADHRVRPGDRLHRLIARMADTWIDDLSDDRILDLEQMVDGWRLTHADASRFDNA
jgi:hypothetical protein